MDRPSTSRKHSPRGRSGSTRASRWRRTRTASTTTPRELMATRTDRTTRILSGVASPMSTSHEANGCMFHNLKNAGNLKHWPTGQIGIDPCIPVATHAYNEQHHAYMAQAKLREGASRITRSLMKSGQLGCRLHLGSSCCALPLSISRLHTQHLAVEQKIQKGLRTCKN